MSYSVYAYLTDADKVEKTFGSHDMKQLNQLTVALKKQFDELNNYFGMQKDSVKDVYAVLADIIMGDIRFAEIAYMYGYVYEKICMYYGRMIYNAENLWQLDKQSAFIPIPFSDDFPYIISIPVSQLEAKKKQYTALKEGQGIGDYDYEQEMDDLKFIFDEAIEAQKDLVIMVY